MSVRYFVIFTTSRQVAPTSSRMDLIASIALRVCFSIEEQTRNAMEAIKSILDEVGATWRDVVKITKYLTDIRDGDGMHRTMRTYFGDWLAASTMICINQLSSPGARVELDMIVAVPPKKAG